MNPDLEALVKAYDALTGCRKEHAADARRGFQALLTDTLAKHSHLERERLLLAVHLAHRRWVRAQDKPTTLPPRA